MLAGIRWIDLAVAHGSITSSMSYTYIVYLGREKSPKKERGKTRIPIPQNFYTNDISCKNHCHSLMTSRKNSISSLALSPRAEETPPKFRSLTSLNGNSSRKEVASEQVADKILEYLVHEIIHGENFFKDLIAKFADLLRARYNGYLDKSSDYSCTATCSLQQSVAGQSMTPSHRKQLSLAITGALSCDARPKDLFATRASEYTESFTKYCPMPKNCTKGTLARVFKDTKEFLNLIEILFYQVVYSFIINEGGAKGSMCHSLDKKLKQTVHSSVFNLDISIHDTISKLIREHRKTSDVNLADRFKKWSYLLPEDFNVDPIFCLSEEEIPYLAAIEALNMVNVVHTPEEKLQTVCFMKNEIVRAVDTYWSQRDPYKKATELTITADQLLTIYTYIVARSGNVKIKDSLMLIEAFLDEQYIKYGEEAYFFATLSVAVDYILDLNARGANHPQDALQEEGGKDESMNSTMSMVALSPIQSGTCSMKKEYQMMLIEEENDRSRTSTTQPYSTIAEVNSAIV